MNENKEWFDGFLFGVWAISIIIYSLIQIFN